MTWKNIKTPSKVVITLVALVMTLSNVAYASTAPVVTVLLLR